MRAEIKIYTDEGKLVAEKTVDACIPDSLKIPADRPVVEGRFRWYGFTYQPHVARSM